MTMSNVDTTPGEEQKAPTPEFRNPGVGFLISLGLASVLLMSSILSVGILTMPLQATAIDADNATTIISVASLFTGIAALIAFPVTGRLSDRTAGRFGRRRPYLIAGAALLLAGAALVLAATSTATLTAGWVVMGIGQIAAFTALGSSVPDQFSPEKRGPASALFGVAGVAGAVIGLWIGSLFSPNITLMIMAPAALGALALLAFAFVLKDDPLAKEARPEFSVREILGSYWTNPVKHPNFGLAFASRFAVFCAIAAVNAYMAVYLILGLHIDPVDVAGKIFLANLLSGGIAFIIANITGRVSDKVGRRKPFVWASALLFTVGLVMIVMAGSYNDFLVALIVMGVGQGIYLAVDFALITQVLPSKEDSAKDLGIMNLASSLPNILVPAVAPALLAIGATAENPQNFSAFFLAAAVAGALGALLIIPIRGVR
ncbi:MFS transporter [Demequina capsici]|uniref:MFS transporter n=1 Tax=Demequina capsici TaxID=3075620 RepID=A0AA96FDW1_9MICO|nr:MFS transporter [Demequina sp. PMTSA13]WNM27685.1 MFS transporter [Demequina sp. PMTSA13]